MIVGHWSSNETLILYIYSFHVPAFFIVSGYLYKPYPWKRMIIAFAIPVLLVSIVAFFIKYILGEITLSSLTMPMLLKLIFCYRYGLEVHLFEGIWFIWALVGLRLMFGDITMKRSSVFFYIPIALVAITYMTFENSLVSIDSLFGGYYLGRIIPSLPFFCFGLSLRDREWTPRKISKFWIITPIIFIFILMPILNGRCDIYGNNYGKSYLIAALNAFLSSLLLFWLTNYFPVNKYVITISKGTLIILGIHMHILHILDRLLPDIISFSFPFITIVLCYYLIIFCERFFPIMLGKLKYTSIKR